MRRRGGGGGGREGERGRKKMYIAAYMSLGVPIHTIDELTESNVGVALDELLEPF